MMRSGDGVQGLNHLSDRLVAGLFRSGWRQSDVKLIRAASPRAIKLEVRSQVAGFLPETCGGLHHLAGDGMDAARRKAFCLFVFAAPGKKRCDKKQYKWSKGYAPAALLTAEQRMQIGCPEIRQHGKLSSFFLRRLQEFERFFEDGIFRRQRARLRRFLLRVSRIAIVVAGVRIILS